MKQVYRVPMLNDEEEEEAKSKKPEEKGPDALAERFLKTRTILLTGEVNKDLGEKIVRNLLMLDAMNNEPINLYIDSPGGDVDAGFAIFDMIRFVSSPVNIIGMGLVASAGALILLASPKERRFGLPNSHYLIHQPLSGLRGVATDIEIHAKELDKTKHRINEVIAEATGQKIDRIAADTDRDYWMNADDALAYGLISKIIVKRTELA